MLPLERLRLCIAFDDTYCIELEVNGEVLSPRGMLIAVPYVFHAIVSDTAYVVGSGAVQTDGTSITGDGTEASRLSPVLGNSIESSEITGAQLPTLIVALPPVLDGVNYPPAPPTGSLCPMVPGT